MFYSIIVFLCTLTEVTTVALSYAMNAQVILTNAVIYGSPLYIIMNLLGKDSAFLEKNPIYIVFALFHVIKYLCFFRSQWVEDTNAMRKTAVIMEAMYLGACAYYSL